jgi:hypothetical protein
MKHAVDRMTRDKNANKILARKQINRPFRRPKHTREDNIKNNIKVIGIMLWAGFVWVMIRSTEDF